ncbi:hypothetical protein SAMN06309944_1420 [Micrococcales bacterium KH10]|nr:hypothetical protein SAMN06309944_1420 [Micrococcales bacterium KH10]
MDETNARISRLEFHRIPAEEPYIRMNGTLSDFWAFAIPNLQA